MVSIPARDAPDGLHILFLSDNFPPEVNAPASRTFEHARLWVRSGHRVTVITCAPNFPQGRVYPGYRNRWFTAERIEGIRVIRVKTFIHANEGFVLRSLDYCSFMLAAFVASFSVLRSDVVVATSPQFFCAIAGWAVGLVRGWPFVFELRDLWPASIAAVGAVGRSPMLHWLERIELFLYRRARAIVSVTHSFKADLRRRGIEVRKVAVVTNGADLSRYQPRERDEELAARHGLSSRFVVGYLGTHGMAHALGRVLDAAELLRDDPRVAFLFLGDGAAKADLIEAANGRDLTNVIFVPAQPKDAMPSWWSCCDLALIHLKDDPVFATVIPSKLFEAMAMGRAVLYAGPAGEASDIVIATGCGTVVPPERPAELVAAIESALADPGRTRAWSQAGLTGVRAFTRERLAGKLLGIMATIASAGRRCRRRPRSRITSQ